jgi:hypothetical protein
VEVFEDQDDEGFLRKGGDCIQELAEHCIAVGSGALLKLLEGALVDQSRQVENP